MTGVFPCFNFAVHHRSGRLPVALCAGRARGSSCWGSSNSMPVEGVSLRCQQGQRSVRNEQPGGNRLKGNKMSAAMAGPRESFEMADEKRLHGLRKRLTDEGYTQVLGFESLPLVNRLFDDLCALRDTHATMAHNLSEKGANEAKLQRQIHPIQKELSRMVRENNQLHLELIQRGEELDTHQRRTSLDTKKLQTKITDQAFIITQQAQHIRDLEQQVDEHRERIQQLLDPNFTYTSGPAGESLPKGQEIVVSACPKPHNVEEEEEYGLQVVHDLDSATADQIAGLEEDLKQSMRKQELLELEVHALQEAIRNREGEITRMGRLLVNNVNSDKEDLEKINSDNVDIIRRLNGQLDFVSGQLADAERQKLYMQQLAEEVDNLRSNESKLKGILSSSNHELQELRALLLQPAGPDRPSGGVPTPSKAGPGEDMHPISGHNPSDMETANRGHTGHETQRQTDKAGHWEQMEALEAALRLRDTECGKLREQVVQGQQTLRESQAKCEQVGAELTEMKRLRDNLYAVVWDFENQMAEVQVKIKELVSAREEKSRQCADAWDKVKMLQQELVALAASSGGVRSSNEGGAPDVQNVAQLIDQLKAYRQRVQALEAQVERADDELAAWAANDASIVASAPSKASDPEKNAPAEEIAELKTCLALSQQKGRSLRVELEQLRSEHEQCDAQKGPIDAKLAEKERAIEQLQSLMSHMDETRGQVVAQLKVHMESAHSNKKQVDLLESEVKRLLGELRRYEDELARSRSAITDIDGERDTLLHQLDEKTQMVCALEAQLSETLKDKDTSLADVTSVQQQADMLRQALNERDAHNKALQQEMQSEVQHRKGAEQLCNAKMEEARVLAAVYFPVFY